MARRRIDNPLALAVLVTVAEQPRHPYEIAQLLRSRGKENSIKINYGSLYTVVRNLEKHGLIAATGVDREGRRPERTTYAVTEAGDAEMREWLSELLSVRVHEFPRFEAALSLMGVLAPDEVTDLLGRRVEAIDAHVARGRAELAELTSFLPRVFLIENEYELAMAEAEARWVRGLLAEIADDSLSGVTEWRHFRATGETPSRWADMDTAAQAVLPAELGELDEVGEPTEPTEHDRGAGTDDPTR
ncbi:PadR family transcriptional regulator [Embleya sp. NPDC008237]|uniref:PadR family transcriptional regulator n=1 Tax=Embleya sp. NPDC008237 TaxID=3363978 RepID=UPI0036E8D68A